MKNLLLLSVIGLFAISCQDEIVERYKVESPVYMTYNELRASVKTTNDQAEVLSKPGKIYYWNKYLFINENNKGIHVIDDSDPSNPVFKTFINIPGNVDMSIKDGILYTDSYIDLVAIDISDMASIKEVKRLDSIFPYTLPELVTEYPMEQIDQKKGVVVGYEQKYVEKDLYNPERTYYPVYYNDVLTSNSFAKISASSGSSGIGVGGSMARFTISENALYAINQSSEVIIFNIENVSDPVKMGTLTVSWGIETLFPYNNKLFIGSQTGMLIYDLVNQYQPQLISTYQHVRSCDPVVVDGDYAYVTLRTGTRCFGDVNRLDIISIANISNPINIKSYDMTNPQGLGIDDSLLFICDGSAGLKVYNVTDKYKLHENLLAQYPENKAFDVIPLGGVLLMTGDDGLFQYDYKNPKDIKLLSKININTTK